MSHDQHVADKGAETVHKLIGARIIGDVRAIGDSAPAFGMLLELPTGQRVTAWITRYAPGSGPGHLEIRS